MKNGGIHLKTTAQAQNEIQSDRSTAHSDVQTDHSSTVAAGSENGAVYANLDWQTNQGRSRQQATQSSYHAETSVAADSHSGGETSITPNSPGIYNDSGAANGTEINGTATSYDPRYSSYGNASSSVNSSVYNDDSTDPSYFGANFGGQSSINASSNPSLDSNYSSLNDLTALLNNHPDFSDFRQQQPNFWHEVQQISQTRVYENTDETQLPELSKYETLVNRMESRKLSLDEFAQTLPPKEAEVFKARVQIDQTFGANIFENDGVTLNANGQVRLHAAIESGEINLPLNLRADLSAERSAPTADDAMPTTREIAFVEEKKDEAEFGRAAKFEQPAITLNNLKNPANSEFKSPDKSAQIAAAAANNNGVNTLFLENGAARTANSGSARSDNSANIGAVTRREGGTATVGGALVGNSLTANSSYKNSESSEINKSHSLNNYDANGGKSFAAGATGAMMSAAIGSLISDSKSHIGGAVGFVSGVFVGVEADQGVRWLGADKNISGTAADISQPLSENSLALNLNLQTDFA